jgi:hypothetical protein
VGRHGLGHIRIAKPSEFKLQHLYLATVLNATYREAYDIQSHVHLDSTGKKQSLKHIRCESGRLDDKFHQRRSLSFIAIVVFTYNIKQGLLDSGNNFTGSANKELLEKEKHVWH